ncbi:immunoglobulin-like domain-containing protein [Thermococcus sp. GR6]|uniref:immunoglobulin-like domain-containing protein n=1 Tax=Thermococcus sp. GR6 TaxID=1638256 RepID=UPI001431E3FC|nr:immunoglobulin-like domain-containing protein [Thermococcus sp. GR6]NJE41973.1 hypothetical protein [Thermococcus sp. GR6]
MRWGLLAVTTVFLLVFGIFYAETVKEKASVGNGTASGAGTVVMVLDRNTYHVGDNLTLTIINRGNRTLLVGSDYELYRLENGSWKKVETGLTFTMIGYMIPPGGNWSQRVPLVVLTKGTSAFGTLEQLPPGRYRIVKIAFFENGKYSIRQKGITLSVEFKVIGG